MNETMMLSQRTFTLLTVTLVVFVGRGVLAQRPDGKVFVEKHIQLARVACGDRNGKGTVLQAIHKAEWDGTVEDFNLKVYPKITRPIREEVNPTGGLLGIFPLVISDKVHFNDVWRKLQCKGKPPKEDFKKYLAVVQFRHASNPNTHAYSFVLFDDHTLRTGCMTSLIGYGRSEQVAYSWFLVPRKHIQRYLWKNGSGRHVSVSLQAPQ
jgi:hypothetical protein